MITALLIAASFKPAAIEKIYPSQKFTNTSRKEKGDRSWTDVLCLMDYENARRKNYRSLDMVSSIVAAFLVRFIGILERPMLMTWQTLYSNALQKVHMGSAKLCLTETEFQVLNCETSQIKKTVVATFTHQCGTGIITLKFHLLYHIIEGLCKVGMLFVSGAFPSEHDNVHIETAYRRTLRRI